MIALSTAKRAYHLARFMGIRIRHAKAGVMEEMAINGIAIKILWWRWIFVRKGQPFEVFIHELGHHLDMLANRRRLSMPWTPGIEQAADKQALHVLYLHGTPADVLSYKSNFPSTHTI